jgi:hypothetical protein
MTPVGIIERAYQLAAQSGSVEENRRKLSSEGYFHVHAHLGGRQIRNDFAKRLGPNLSKVGEARAPVEVALGQQSQSKRG